MKLFFDELLVLRPFKPIIKLFIGQLFYPFREKLNSYRGYPIIGDKAFKSSFRSCIINKNRYGIANQVIGMAFYGSVGFLRALRMMRKMYSSANSTT